MKRIKAEVISNIQIMPNVYLIWLKACFFASTASPGQFVMLHCDKDILLRRPLSIHQTDTERGYIALLFQVVGQGTNRLAQIKPGAMLDLLGPLGNGFSLSLKSENILLVGGGIGIAPLPFMARTSRDRGCSVTMLLGATTAEQLCPHHLIPSSIKCINTTNDGTKGEKGFITDLLPEYIDKADQIFACGPSPMYRVMAKMSELRDKPVQISLEVRMGCGFGLCYGCTIRTKSGLKQVCKDGPVFELNDILWDEFVDI
ncbi:MAG: dihydroorotate dehydrogenase electron transfer subunit [Dehalococcoidia bacterium]|nr:MAG: dihydroorotate dehydrogenase electron transfer subunit [Dehalococcoidia bacterium]